MAAIPEFAMRQIERWCAQRGSEGGRVECRVRERAVVLVERLDDAGEREIAQLSLDEFGIWSMLRPDGAGGWLADPDAPVASTPPPLLAQL
ncbi:hypothetical protein ACIA5G_00850 [Amycolatopsis sp. NPDC051758]|uniref:DUF3024 domain-containing protein n=1 Tax=Amycolatopsis sp. NPDC051758 TaxID=3363935 RepID=UPI00378E250B